MKKARFMLRQEDLIYADGRPCGGILHDNKKLACYSLSPELFNFLTLSDQKLINAERIKAERKLSKIDLNLYREFVGQGIIAICHDEHLFTDQFRVVRNKILPQHCLSMPLRVYHSVTRKCNLACPQCLLTSHNDFPEERMSAGEIEELMSRCYELGVPEWRFTGGEPTFCKDFFRVAFYAKKLGMSLMLNSNGCWNTEIMDEVLDVGFNEIIISLEGDEIVNDSRRSDGSYRRIMRTLNELANYNECVVGQYPDKTIRVTINMTVARDNFNDIEHVIRLAADRKFNANFVPLRPYGRSLEGLKDQILSAAEFMELGKLAQKLREDPRIKASGIKIIHKNMDLFCPDYPDRSGEPWPFSYGDCGALTTGWGICPDGKANACSFLMSDPYFTSDEPLLQTDIQSVWLGEKMDYFRNAEKVICESGCNFYHKQCEGMCRAMVLANYGRIENGYLHGRDPYCFRHLMPK